MRGKFTAEDAHAAAMTLAAYTIGLIPFVLMRSVVATFLARGDTATPVKAALTAAARQHRAQDRVSLHHRAGAGRPCARDLARCLDQFRPDRLVRACARASSASTTTSGAPSASSRSRALSLAAALWIAQWPVLAVTAGLPHATMFAALLLLALRSAPSSTAPPIFGLFGKAWLVAFWRGRSDVYAAASAPPAFLRHQSERARLAEPQHVDLDRLARSARR